MPPKRGAKKGGAAKAAKIPKKDDPTDSKSIVKKLRDEDAKKSGKKKLKVDSTYLANVTVRVTVDSLLTVLAILH